MKFGEIFIFRFRSHSGHQHEQRLSAAAVSAMRAVLGRDIVSDRERLGWTQAELARRAGVRVETLNRIETGKRTPSVATIEKIDEALRGGDKGRRQSSRG